MHGKEELPVAGAVQWAQDGTNRIVMRKGLEVQQDLLDLPTISNIV